MMSPQEAAQDSLGANKRIRADMISKSQNLENFKHNFTMMSFLD